MFEAYLKLFHVKVHTVVQNFVQNNVKNVLDLREFFGDGFIMVSSDRA